MPPPPQPIAQAASAAHASRTQAVVSETTGCSENESDVVDTATLVEGLGSNRKQRFEGVVARAVRPNTDAKRASELLRFEAVQVLAEDIAHRVVHGSVEPHPDRPLVLEVRDRRAPIDEPAMQKTAHRTRAA